MTEYSAIGGSVTSLLDTVRVGDVIADINLTDCEITDRDGEVVVGNVYSQDNEVRVYWQYWEVMTDGQTDTADGPYETRELAEAERDRRLQRAAEVGATEKIEVVGCIHYGKLIDIPGGVAVEYKPERDYLQGA